MSEMLANHYFLNRNFLSAKTIYDGILEKDSDNKSVKKKLIICYLTTSELDKSFELFLSQIRLDIDFILKNDLNAENCPCPDLAAKVESGELRFKTDLEKFIALGILWLYCSLEKSVEFFKKAEAVDPDNNRIKVVNSILVNKLITNRPNSIN